MEDVSEKLEYFKSITGVQDHDLCTEILQAHNWDLELAISSFTSSTAPSLTNTTHHFPQPPPPPPPLPPIPLAWKLIKLPVTVISGSLGLLSGAIGLGLWAAGGVLSYSLGIVGLGSFASSSTAPLVSVSAATSEAMDFVAEFERDYGSIGTIPSFVSEGFMDALQRSRNSFRLLFVYLHSPDHPDTPLFCERTLCSETVTAFVNHNFVAWGGSIRASEGFKMSNSLKASRFPFCAVVMAAANQRIALLQQVEGPKSPEEMLVILQRVLEESSPVLVAARLDAEERQNNARLREEQDAAYRAALDADQARERQRREEEERLAKEAAEAERKRKEEEEAHERAAQEAAEKQAALAKLREEKAQSLGEEPEKGPDVTQVLVRFPNGERKGRRFNGTATIQSLYDYVDSLGCLETESYSLVSNFPRVVYGQEKLTLSLKETGLHPQASLFVELNS
ncbi:putative UBX domain-containing protein 2/7 [Lupinus albus]|uniref:Putative UBX domain-containing protein 2/7 n=1 Tax=Lupinus albus TaxID=3870 RepID=A0A6A4R176_LUPAL|nr:putative UBX domain-containing protein 2/7 [Lupinus albus]